MRKSPVGFAVSGKAAIVVVQNFVTGAYEFTMVGDINF
jgi:hypothetical protein